MSKIEPGVDGVARVLGGGLGGAALLASLGSMALNAITGAINTHGYYTNRPAVAGFGGHGYGHEHGHGGGALTVEVHKNAELARKDDELTRKDIVIESLRANGRLDLVEEKIGAFKAQVSSEVDKVYRYLNNNFVKAKKYLDAETDVGTLTPVGAA